MSAFSPAAAMEFPCGALTLKSPLYIERPPVESLCYQNLQISGSLTRIKGPRHIGKSSLLVRVLDRAHHLNYRTVIIDFQSAEDAVYQDTSRFLRWFCVAVASALGLPPLLEDYWDEDIGAKLSTTLYFEEYLLEERKQSIVLALNEVNRVFEQPKIARDFLPLLRVWYEKAKQASGEIPQEVGFQKLRVLVVHSTDVYVPLDIHKSPFNVGLPIQLKPFNRAQTQQLAERYNVTLAHAQAFESIWTLVGGHPYLLSIAFYYLSQDQFPVAQLLAEAPTLAGIYRHHLQSCLEILQGQLPLIKGLQQVMTSLEPVEVDAAVAYQLSSIGLVLLEGSACRPACELYRLFFSRYVQPINSYISEIPLSGTQLSDTQFSDIQKLQTENEQLKVLANIDGLTQIANRRRFDERADLAWQDTIKQRSILSLIMLDIDFFKRYNDTYGHLAGDFCLKKVAKVLQHRVSRHADTVARYGGEEFAVILPGTTLSAATRLAHKVREGIRALNIIHNSSELADKIVTSSIGVASVIPRQGQCFAELVAAADGALYVSKQQGRDRVTVSDTLIGGSLHEAG